jgi:hypothetical protein
MNHWLDIYFLFLKKLWHISMSILIVMQLFTIHFNRKYNKLDWLVFFKRKSIRFFLMSKNISYYKWKQSWRFKLTLDKQWIKFKVHKKRKRIKCVLFKKDKKWESLFSYKNNIRVYIIYRIQSKEVNKRTMWQSGSVL